ncbi:ubiquinone biosynthesis protein COQ4 homolog, mitochondrial [Lingula anatina]|uniref:Ubiquinone biosynthesis protein COQ4 homolog, mitochondrial n=1 Tax=Lingula anatina TaxID=7574 RepID=A0A1S3K3U8_LINAN|nr:ubiquinone biosynthesis protein COQ4 homolog, mitochondrial [Lingula anatina]|eukprot:XP_013417308.1 ubiquinone biosynthesis protein COQ4 homolog, mitochondrial [Lingula anatina]
MSAPVRNVTLAAYLFNTCRKCILSRQRNISVAYLIQQRRGYTHLENEDSNRTYTAGLKEPFHSSSSDSSSSDSSSSDSDTDDRMDKDFSAQYCSQYDVLYPGHISTTLLQKSLLAVGSGVMAITNPWRDDMIATFGETTGYFSLQLIRRNMQNHPEGKQILQEKPVINSRTVDLPFLENLPENTFGKHYWNFLNTNGFSPDARLPVSFVDDVELAYVMLRYRQIHDLVHTVCGMKPNMLGEVAVKWVEAFQTGLPMCVLGAVFGPVRFGPRWRKKYAELYLPWSLKTGYNANNLMCVYYEKHWERDIKEFRKELNISLIDDQNSEVK